MNHIKPHQSEILAVQRKFSLTSYEARGALKRGFDINCVMYELDTPILISNFKKILLDSGLEQNVDYIYFPVNYNYYKRKLRNRRLLFRAPEHMVMLKLNI